MFALVFVAIALAVWVISRNYQFEPAALCPLTAEDLRTINALIGGGQ